MAGQFDGPWRGRPARILPDPCRCGCNLRNEVGYSEREGGRSLSPTRAPALGAASHMNDSYSVTPQDFRAALGRFSSGVTVITIETAEGQVHGMTASSFCSVSLRPPLVLVCIDQLAETYLHLRERGRFGVSVLKEDQEALSEFFADPERNPDAARRLGVHYNLMKSGVPVVADTLSNLDCLVMQDHAAGDHTIFVAEVKEVSVAEGSPLLYFRGRYGGGRERQER
jgi:flavin reductase